MKNCQNSRVEQQDARDLYLLVGECRSLGGDGITWRRHLVDRMIDIFDADMVFFLDNQIVGEPESPEGWVRPTAVVDHWPSEASRKEFMRFLRDGRHEHTPMAYMIDGREGARVASRSDICPDDNQWREHPFYQGYFVPCNMDEFVHTVNQGPDGLVQMLTMKRFLGRSPFSKKIIHMLRALWIELRRYQPQELRPVADSAFMHLPKRMLQVLACILAGFTAKETAAQLEISIHTVHVHLKRLYKRSGASNRAELADLFRDIAPTLLTIPLSEIPDPKQRIKEATLKPWPRLPGNNSGDFQDIKKHE